MRAATICLMLLCAAHGTASAAGSGKGSGPPSVAAQMQAARGGGGGYGRMLEDPRKAPPLDPNRKIAVQDCSKPVDHAAGNLKCK
jgi:hypothetical protein